MTKWTMYDTSPCPKCGSGYTWAGTTADMRFECTDCGYTEDYTKENFKPLADFYKAGVDASFHFADDSTKEWELAYKAERKALEIFDNYPDLQEYFRKIALDFLWSLSQKRPQKA